MQFSYTEIKEAYLEIKNFLEHTSGDKVENLNIRIMEDLGLWGDDNFYMLIEFNQKYDVDFCDFNYSIHFEDEGFDSYWGCFLNTLSLPFKLIHFLIYEVVGFISPKCKAWLRCILNETNVKLDLTFGDLVASKLAGQFSLRKDAKIELLTAK